MLIFIPSGPTGFGWFYNFRGLVLSLVLTLALWFWCWACVAVAVVAAEVVAMVVVVAAAVCAGAALLSGPCLAGCEPAPTNLPGVAVARYSQQAGKQEARQQASSIRARSQIDGKALPPHWNGIMFRRLRAQRRLEINATSSGRLLVRSWTFTRTGKDWQTDCLQNRLYRAGI